MLGLQAIVCESQTITFPQYLWVFYSNKPIRHANASRLHNKRKILKGHNISGLLWSFQETRNRSGLVTKATLMLTNGVISPQRALRINAAGTKLQKHTSCHPVAMLAHWPPSIKETREISVGGWQGWGWVWWLPGIAQLPMHSICCHALKQLKSQISKDKAVMRAGQLF